MGDYRGRCSQRVGKGGLGDACGQWEEGLQLARRARRARGPRHQSSLRGGTCTAMSTRCVREEHIKSRERMVITLVSERQRRTVLLDQGDERVVLAVAPCLLVDARRQVLVPALAAADERQRARRSCFR
eukprot:6203841-Pleurochrysis_carterae.AAC.2